MDQAAAYLKANQALRDAVAAAPDELLQPRYLGKGEHNLNFVFDVPSTARTYVLRVNVLPQPFHDNQIAYEYAALCTLAACGCTPQPIYVDSSPDAPGAGALVESFCEGDQLDFDNLRPGDLECAAQLMAAYHAVEVAPACPLHAPADPARELFAECVQRYRIYQDSGFAEQRISRRVDALLSCAQRALDVPWHADEASHVINTETLASHFLIPAQAAHEASRGIMPSRPGFFVDWERPIVGEVAQDIAYFVSPTTTFWDSECLFAPSMAEQLVDAYWRAVDGRFARGSFDARFETYAVLTTLRSITWCCRALAYHRAGVAPLSDKAQQKLPVYLSDDFLDAVAPSGLRGRTPAR